MATGKSSLAPSSYRFFSNEPPIAASATHHDSAFELDESDVYYSNGTGSPATNNSPEPRKSARASRKKSSSSSSDCGGRRGATPSSLPVNIPDWSKILRGEYTEGRRRDSSFDDYDYDSDDGGAFGGGGDRVPPHEFLARQMERTKITSSVHEGVGRTLKGRDLSRVRNAIWEKTGFQD